MNAKLLSAQTVRDQVKFFLNRKDLTLLERRNAELALGHLNEVVADVACAPTIQTERSSLEC